MEWTFGITDHRPRSWKRREPQWEDEQITASNQHTFHEVMNKLCETALAKRREHADYGVNSHLWNLEICSERRLFAPKSNAPPLFRSDDWSTGSESDSEDDEDRYRGIVKVMPMLRRELLDDERCTYVASGSKLSSQVLPSGHIIKVTYDYGTTTTLYLKVLSVRHKVANCLLKYFEAENDAKGQTKDLKAVPAHAWSKEKRIDAYYPNYSKTFLGDYVPLLKKQQDDDEYPDQLPQNPVGCATLGLTARIRSEKDTVFATIEDAGCSQDLMFAGMMFKDMNEFLAVAEQSWTPLGEDSDKLHRYRYNGVARYLFPKCPEADEVHEAVQKTMEEDPWAAYTSKKLYYRLPKEDDKSGDSSSNIRFDFAKAFPKTAAQLSSGKFRWFQYKKGVLRILVGRGIGDSHRDYEKGQILRTWKQPFDDFHELLCAVEASWVYCGKPLTLDTELSYFDADLGPSHPGPKDPASFGKADDAVLISRCNDKKKLVTALAIAEEGNGNPVLYSGHNDGTLTKWCLETNNVLWSKAIYADATDEHNPNNVTYGIKETTGVAGIVIRWDETLNGHRIYTWTHMYEGYPSVEPEDQDFSKVKCWSGKDGSFLHSYSCDVGDDDGGNPAKPSIATVVFCRLRINRFWFDSMIVGLSCLCDVGDYETDYDDFDLEDAQELSEGNILPFFESGDKRAMDSWRGHGGIIQAMAVVPDKYLLSYSMRHGHGLPDAMILWDLTQPGVPLCRHDFWDPRRSLYKQNQTRLGGVAGISACGNDILLCCEYGDRIAVITVEDEDGDPSLQLHGYGTVGNRYYDSDNFHGRMAMSGEVAAMINEGSTDVWLFPIEGNANHAKLDKREGNPRLFRGEDYEEEDDVEDGTNYQCSGREIAVGRVVLPKFGGEAPKRKKRRSMFRGIDGSYDTGDGWGVGGPIAVATNGKWLVAGFINGSLVRSPLLSDLAQVENTANESNTLASFSPLPSDEWHHPVLESEDD